MKKKRSVVVGIVLALVVAMCAMVSVFAYSPEDDPLVTLSYLTEIVVPQIRDNIMGSVTDLLSDTYGLQPSDKSADSSDGTDAQTPPPAADTVPPDLTPDSGTDVPPQNPDRETTNPSNDDNPAPGEENMDTVTMPATYQVVELKFGNRLVAKNGALELILRPGSRAVVLSPFEDQGIADLTNGAELLDGAELPINAYLLLPRADDGRAVEVTSDVAYLMIRGEYEIVE